MTSAINAYADSVLNPWTSTSLQRLAQAELVLPKADSWLLEGDFRSVVLRWLAESAQPPGSEDMATHVQKFRIFAQARAFASWVEAGLPEADQVEEQRAEFARALGRLAWLVAEAGATGELRLSSLDRRELLDEAGEPPRCYMCGAKFGQTAVQRFLGNTEETPPASLFVDLLFPRGCRGRDLLVEVDHVRPKTKGGQHSLDNLRLACGFCNRMKSNTLTLLDRTRYGREVMHPTLGRMASPHPSWVLRLLALSGACCECGSTSRTTRLVVVPIVWSRYINPLNLRVFCEDHDAASEVRMVKRETALGQGSSAVSPGSIDG